MRISHNLPRTAAILLGGLVALFAIIAAGMGSALVVAGLYTVRAAAAPVRRLRGRREHVVRPPAAARPAAHVEPAL